MSTGALAQDAEPVIGVGTLPRDLTPWGMYLNADPVVKAVLIGLAFASVVTWTVWLAKSIELWSAKRRVRRALQRLASARSTVAGVERLSARDGEVRAFLDAAVTELKLSDGAFERDGIKVRPFAPTQEALELERLCPMGRLSCCRSAHRGQRVRHSSDATG